MKKILLVLALVLSANAAEQVWEETLGYGTGGYAYDDDGFSYLMSPGDDDDIIHVRDCLTADGYKLLVYSMLTGDLIEEITVPEPATGSKIKYSAYVHRHWVDSDDDLEVTFYARVGGTAGSYNGQVILYLYNNGTLETIKTVNNVDYSVSEYSFFQHNSLLKINNRPN